TAQIRYDDQAPAPPGVSALLRQPRPQYRHRARGRWRQRRLPGRSTQGDSRISARIQRARQGKGDHRNVDWRMECDVLAERPDGVERPRAEYRIMVEIRQFRQVTRLSLAFASVLERFATARDAVARNLR